MKLKDFIGGLNTFNPPEDIRINEFAKLVNVSYEEGNLLRSRSGLRTIRSVTNVRSIYPFYIGGTVHLIYTCSGGLYDGNTLLDSLFTGAFTAEEYDDMLYLSNKTYYYRYDGSRLYNVGVEAPDAPTVVASDRDELVLDTFDDNPVDYARQAAPYNGGATGAVARTAVAGEFVEGTAGIKFTVNEGQILKILKTAFPTPQDWTAFSTGPSDESDYITFKVKLDNQDNLRYFQVLVDVDDGTFSKNYYYTGKIVKGTIYGSHVDRANILKKKALGVYAPFVNSGATLPLGSPGDWVEFAMPKVDFERFGSDSTKNWSTVKRLGFVIWANADTGTADLVGFIDDGVMKGAAGVEGGFYGRYYFCANYASQARNEYYEVSEEAGPVDCNVNAVDVTVPTTFADAQADRYQVWARKEDWSNWFRVVNAAAGGTGTEKVGFKDTSIINNPELTEQTGIYPLPIILGNGAIKTRDNSNNSKPPVPSFIRMHRGKMMMVVASDVYHTKPGQPWACPVDNYLRAASSSDPVQALHSDGTNLVVHSKTKDFNYVNAGEYDVSGVYMGYVAEGRRTAGCVSGYTLDSGIYASTFGIMTFDGQDGLSMSTKVKPTFKALAKKTELHGVVFEDFYLLVSPTGNSLVMEMEGLEENNNVMLRFYEWNFSSTPRCCAVDGVDDTLYIGTDTGIYAYDTSRSTDSEGSGIEFEAWSGIIDIGRENTDMPIAAASVLVDTGGNVLTVEFWLDGELVDEHEIQNDEKTEEELILAEGCVGSFLQIRFSATVTGDFIKIYQIEVS